MRSPGFVNPAAIPLALKRSRIPLVLLTLLFVLLVAGLSLMGRPPVLRIGIAVLLVFYCIKRLRSGRYLIEIDERGILDGSVMPTRIGWHEITDIDLEVAHDTGALLLKLSSASSPVRIDLDGTEAPLQTVFSSAQAFWHAARQAPKAASQGVTPLSLL